MELCFRTIQIYLLSSSFWYGLSFLVVVFQHSATTALRQVVQQQHTVLGVTTHRSVSSSAVTAAASASATAVVKTPTDNDSWLCRISKPYEACGNREYHGVYPAQLHVYCPDNFCCSKTACFGSCGSWCHDSWALCSSSVVYHVEWSYGNCNCKRFGHQCHADAECVHLNEANGGSYCQCRTGFLGNGKTCVRDYCAPDPCNPGECQNLADGYTCTCPDTHRLETVNNRDVCKEKPNYCRYDPCGPAHMVEECINKEDGHECKCKPGYTVRNNRCEEIDLCVGSPCGPAEGVHSCVTEREPKFRYRCQCKDGYDKRLLADGESEICQKNWCYDNPCGPQERVMDCNSTDSGYSCLCRDNYVVETGETGKEKCVKEDVCKNNPCGPPDIAKRCYAEGSAYRCECQPGYVEFDTGGHKTCKEGDPCLLEACGGEERVLECSTDGSNYTCTCREPDFLLGTEDGRKTCLSKQECIDNCGPVEAIRTCAIKNGSFVCKCNEGFATSYREGKRTCVQQDVCALAPCGPEDAVELCTPNTSGSSSPYKCTCKEDYEVRILEDKSEVCAEEGSCVGNPCGSPDIVKACIADESGYSCQCAEQFEQGMLGGRKRCVPARTEEYEEQFRTESGGTSNAAIAGSVVGGLVLIGSVGAGIVYFRKKDEDEEEDSSEDERQEARPEMPPTALGIPPRAIPAYQGPTPGV